MRSQKLVKSVSAPILLIGIILVVLWAALLYQTPAVFSQASQSEEGFLFPMALPTVLAPVIRNEVHKEQVQEQEKRLYSFRVPSLWQIFNVKQ